MILWDSELLYDYLESFLLYLLFNSILKLLGSVQHITVRNDSSKFVVNNFSFHFLLIFMLRDCFVLSEFVSTSTRPRWCESFTSTSFAILFPHIMLLIRMLTTTLEVLRTIYRNIVEISTFTACILAFNFTSSCLQKVVIFVWMVAEAFRWRAHCFTAKILRIVPWSVQSILW